ncbi:MAG: tRNA (adenosine(37)-N6)-dimethylallyltransferase MiaA [Pseudomonadota bacterium]
MTTRLFILVGPTASGKTELALALAKKFPFEIVNADSLQIFRHLDIGTAKPTPEQLRSVPHHLIDVLDPHEPATAAWYAKEAVHTIAGIAGRNHLPLVVGGSGFYLRAIEHPPQAEATDFETSAVSENDYEFLKTNDPEAARKIHPNDRYRIGRAVSLLRKGVHPSERWEAARNAPSPFETHWLGIDLPRDGLHRRIDRRMERMFSAGLIDETRNVLERFPASEKRLSRSIGYAQALRVVRGTAPLAPMIEEAKARSRQLAKRQITWFRRESRIASISGTNLFSDAVREIERVLTP